MVLVELTQHVKPDLYFSAMTLKTFLPPQISVRILLHLLLGLPLPPASFDLSPAGWLAGCYMALPPPAPAPLGGVWGLGQFNDCMEREEREMQGRKEPSKKED